MDSIFSYDSKLVQMLLKLADLMILNILFVLCSLPIVTVGAAQTALHAGINQLQNKENDKSCYKAFFKGFANGFLKITLVHSLGAVLILLLIWAAGIAWIREGSSISSWICILGVVFTILFHCTLTLFHAHFDCTAKQLVKNVFLMTMAHPLRTLAVGLLTWAPLLIFLLDLYSFLKAFPIWFFLYYATAFLFCHTIMKKPYNELKDEFRAAQEENAGPLDGGSGEDMDAYDAAEDPGDEADEHSNAIAEGDAHNDAASREQPAAAE